MLEIPCVFFQLDILNSLRAIATRKYNKHIANAVNVPRGIQMNTFHIVHPTGLLYSFMHNMSICERNAMKFGKRVPE